VSSPGPTASLLRRGCFFLHWFRRDIISLGHEFPGHHTNQACYKSGIMPPEYQVTKSNVPNNLTSFICYCPAWPSAYLVLATTRTFQLSPGPIFMRGFCSATRDSVHARTYISSCQFLVRTRRLVRGLRNWQSQGHHTNQAYHKSGVMPPEYISVGLV
jgi:hypothetical protein